MRPIAKIGAWLACLALAAGCAGSVVTPNAGGIVPIGGGVQFAVLYSFKGTPDGAQPEAGLIAVNGALYGTSYFGGERDAGTVYRITPVGEEAVVYSFQSGFRATDGSHPRSDLIAFHDRLLFGTTVFGGGARNLFCAGAGCGTIFQVGVDGSSYISRYSFPSAMVAARPSTGLIETGAHLYGTTVHGGGKCGFAGCGTIFEFNPTGAAFVNIKNLEGSNHEHKDGAGPLGVLVGIGSSLYGTTDRGGSNDRGTLFKFNPSGAIEYDRFHSFNDPAKGSEPKAGLIAYNGVLYGTTYYGGTHDNGTIFKIDPDGTGYAVLHNFSRAAGANPEASLIVLNGTLYGTTYWGGTHNAGSVFSISASGSDFHVIHNFDGTNGSHPLARLVYYRGMLYGTTRSGGASDKGTVFQIGPFEGPSPSPSTSPTASPSPSSSPTMSPSPKPTPTPSPRPTPTPSPRPTLTPTPRPTPTPTATPTPNPTTFYAYVKSLHPLAYYRLDATTGSAVADSSGNGYTGTLVGSAKLGVPGLLSGDPDKAIDLTRGYVTLPTMTAHKDFTLLTLVRSGTYGLPRTLVGYFGNYLAIQNAKLKWCPAFTKTCSDSLSPRLDNRKAYLLVVTASISNAVAKVGCSTNGATLVDCNRARFGTNALLSTGNFLGHGSFFPDFRGTLDESIVFPAVLTQTQIAKLAKAAGY